MSRCISGKISDRKFRGGGICRAVPKELTNLKNRNILKRTLKGESFWDFFCVWSKFTRI